MHLRKRVLFSFRNVFIQSQHRFYHFHSSPTLFSQQYVRSVPAAHPPSRWFNSKRDEILRNLKHGENDKSLAGAIDVRVRPLVDWINYHTLPSNELSISSSTSTPTAMTNSSTVSPSPPLASSLGFVTTSSCSGRILLFHREDKIGVQRRMKRGGLGLGKLIESHDPLENVKEAVRTIFIPTLEKFSERRNQHLSSVYSNKTDYGGTDKEESSPVAHPLMNDHTELLHLQFHPMILHVMVSNMEAAKELLNCALAVGQNASSILSCSHFKEEPLLEEGEEVAGNNGRHDSFLGSSFSCSSSLPSSSVGHSPALLSRPPLSHMVPRKIICCITSTLLMDVPLKTNSLWMFGGPPYSPLPSSSSTSSLKGSGQYHSPPGSRGGRRKEVDGEGSRSCNCTVISDPWTPFLEHCIFHANQLFKENFRRMDRFFEEVRKRLSATA